jgi:HAD superfamily hydrolase (TIGR01509 family)
MKNLVIFDCDGVLIDSEIVSNRIEAEFKSELGFPISLEDQLKKFVGYGSNHTIIQEEMARLPEHYKATVKSRVYSALSQELKAIPHVHETIRSLPFQFCIASSSTMEKLEFTLGLTDLLVPFKNRIYSATEVKNPKPAPDVYLWVAKEAGCQPQECIAIEDSIVGIKSAKAAGMRVIAFTGATHSFVFSEKELLDAGAMLTFSDMRKLPQILQEV